jgi:signal peptidase I
MNSEHNIRRSTGSELDLNSTLRMAHEHIRTSSPALPAQSCPKVQVRETRALFWEAMAADLRQRMPILIGLFLCCAASYFLASRYMVCTVVIRGRSMIPTLRDGDQYLLNRIAYLFREPRRGDLVVIHDPGHKDMAIKRIVGLPGDRVEIKEGVLYINQKPLNEAYLAPHTKTLPGDATQHSVQLGSKQYFVMGDNRSESEDSRYYGPIHHDKIVGVVSL